MDSHRPPTAPDSTATLSDLEPTDQVEAFHNGYWLPCIILGHSGEQTKVMLRYPLKPEQISIPGDTQVRWPKVAA